VTRKHLVELECSDLSLASESFLQSPDVVVTDRKDFEEAMKPWLSDPCDVLRYNDCALLLLKDCNMLSFKAYADLLTEI
jgi:hypothetical protein